MAYAHERSINPAFEDSRPCCDACSAVECECGPANQTACPACGEDCACVDCGAPCTVDCDVNVCRMEQRHMSYRSAWKAGAL